MKELTDRQQQLLGFIADHVQSHGFPPSIREMADHMGIRSTNGVNDHLKALERKGYISRGRDLKSRAISLLTDPRPRSDTLDSEPVLAVPILGRVAAGQPVLSEENIEGTLHLGSSMLNTNRKIFALRIHGESMIEKGIFDGDIVFVKPQQTADNGQTVVAMVDGEATVKTFRRTRSAIHLEPANPDMEPIVIRKVDFKPTSIIGVVTGVFRLVS
jgi:repressor LexA